LLVHIDESVAFIEEALSSGSILVHCAAGVSRSASLTVAYVMKQMGLSYEQALELVMKKRWVSPNQGFEQQLKQYQERLGIAKKPTMVYCN